MSDLDKRISGLSPAKRALFEKRIRGGSGEETTSHRIPRRPDQGSAPLSFAQRRMWFLDKLEPESPFYNVSRAFSIDGPLNIDALERSINEIVSRHDVLRTTFPSVDGKPVQVIAPWKQFSLEVFDVGDLPREKMHDRARDLATEEALRPFNLSEGPLFRFRLIRLGGEEHIFLLVVHHIVSDGWSMGVFFHELAVLYETCSGVELSPLPDLPIQYADFASWQRQWFQGEVLEKQLSYWRQQLSGELPILELPADHPRPPVQTFNGKTRSFRLPLDLLESLKTVSRNEGVTLFMTLLAAFQSLLYRYTGQDDIIVGTPIANRNRAEIEGLIGFFVNTLVMRTDFSGETTFRELLDRVRKVALGAYTHQDLPFEKLVEELQPRRDMSRTPLFQVMFQLRNLPKKALTLPGLEIEEFHFERKIARFDLTVDVTEDAEGLSCLFEYNTDLFQDDTIERMEGHFRVLLEGMAENLDRDIATLPLLTEDEYHQVVDEWNDTGRDFPDDVCIHHLFESQVRDTPEATALVFEESTLTYGELNERANRLGHYLRKGGVGPDVLVAICMERSIEMVVGILGVIKAGGAYVPLDPTYPGERLKFMLEDTRAPVLLTQERLLKILPHHDGEIICLDSDWDAISRESGMNPPGEVTPENLAYVIYTSGSTGTPKGVMIPHSAICNHLFWIRTAYPLTEEDAVLQNNNVIFDPSVLEFFTPLVSGARLVMVPQGKHFDIDHLIDLIHRQRITFAIIIPSMLKVFVEKEDLHRCDSLKHVISGGEVLPEEIKERFLASLSTNLYNLYGPTEATIVATAWTCRREDKRRPIPIGRPIANFTTYILDRHLQPLPAGVPGELHIGGAGLARGYLNRPELTAENFIPDPFSDHPGATLYRTGDLARYLPDGNIEFLGRTDHQVKVRGYRIELGEIESVLRDHVSVKDAVVVHRDNGSGGRTLVSYLLTEGNPSPSVSEIRTFLQQKLPDYMVPSSFVKLDAFPLNPSGKIDRSALPEPGFERPEMDRAFVSPEDELEKELAEMWKGILGIKQIGIRDDFFELGGHSLLAVELFARIEKTFGRTLPLTTLFHATTVEALANVIREDPEKLHSLAMVPVQPKGSKLPFFCVHYHEYLLNRYSEFSEILGEDQPLYVLLGEDWDQNVPPEGIVEKTATECIEDMRTIQPEGPYLVGGYCFGGKVAYEIAQQLHAQGQEVRLLAIIDAYAPGYPERSADYNRMTNKLRRYVQAVSGRVIVFREHEPGEKLAFFLEQVKGDLSRITQEVKQVFDGLIYKISRFIGRHTEYDPEKMLVRQGPVIPDYEARTYPGKVTLFRFSREVSGRVFNPTLGWGDLAEGGVEVHELNGYQRIHPIVMKPIVTKLAGQLKECIDRSLEAGSREGM